MKKTVLFAFALLTFNLVSAQYDTEVQDTTSYEELPADEYEEEDADAFFIDHKVTMGEKIIMISKKYMVDPKDIYKYNEEAVNGVDAGIVLKIPLHKSHKKDLEGFKKKLEKEKGGPIQVPAPPRKKKRTPNNGESQEY